MKYREPNCVHASAIFRVGLHLVVSVSLLITIASQAIPLHAQATTSFEGDSPGGVTRYDNADGLLQFASGGHVVGFGAGEMYVAAADHVLRAEFVGARPVMPTSKGEPPESAAYAGLWDGVTAVYERGDGGVLKSTYHVAPGASAEWIRLRYNVPVRPDGGGGLLFDFDAGQMRESAPVAWQDIDGMRVPVDVSFRLLAEREVGFDVGAYDPAHPLVIDPTLVWNTFLGGPGSPISAGYDFGGFIATDGAGNVYVSGVTNGTWGTPVNPYSGDDDAFVAKLDGSGVLQWNTFLGSPQWDSGGSIVIDDAGNVYVTGLSEETWGTPVNAHSGGGDAFVAKLNSSGVLQWSTFLGASGADYGRAITVDGDGNVYVGGISDATWGTPVRPYSGDDDVFVAKLNNSGVLQWNTFLGSSQYDSCNAIDVDTAGNVYASGTSSASWGTPINPHSGAWDDVFVAKLDDSGALQWNTFTIGGMDIAVDASGNVYTTDGSSVAKLNGSGALQWNAPIGGGSSTAIEVDGSGNIYVGGTSYNTWGTPVSPYSGYEDAFVAKLNDSGVLQWNTFLGSQTYDYGVDIDIDALGNIYVGGYGTESWGTPLNPHAGGSFDVFVGKVDDAGTLLWNTFIGAPGWDDSNAVAVDNDGNVYVVGIAGTSWGTPLNPHSGDSEAYVAKLNDNGVVQWHTFLGSQSWDYGDGIALDGDGNIYVAGSSGASWGTPVNPHLGTSDTFVAKLNNSGVLQWNTFLGSTGWEVGRDIALDTAGNIYVVGTSEATWGTPVRPHSGNSDTFVAKLNGSGALQWHTFLGSSREDYGEAITVGNSGSVYVAGISSGTWGTPVNPFLGMWHLRDAFVAQLDGNNGVLQWNTFQGSNSDDYCDTIAVDGAENVYIAGTSDAAWGTPVNPYSGESTNAFAVKLNNNGVLQWNTFVGAAWLGVLGHSTPFMYWSYTAGAIALDGEGNAYVVSTQGSGINLAKLDGSGDLQWDTTFGFADFGSGVAVSGDSAYVVGAGNSTWGTPVNPHAGGGDGLVARFHVSGEGCWARVNDGATLYTDVQSAIDAAVDGDTVKVAGYCTGVENRGFVVHGTSYVTRTQTAIITESITLQGGYTTTNWIDPDPVANPTTLDALGQGRVIYIEGPISTTVEGLNITNGDATGLGGGEGFGDSGGGGMYILADTVTLTNNQVFSNTAGVGGGMYILNSTPTISNNRVFGNTAHRGGGAHVEGSDGTFSGNTVSGNSADGYGGGLFFYTSTTIISNNDVISNSGSGGVYLVLGETEFSNNNVVDNYSADTCGGMTVFAGHDTITGNTISENRADVSGGGLCLTIGSATATGNIINNNSAPSCGGVWLGGESNDTLSNSIIFDNDHEGVCVDSSSPHLLHNTIADNETGVVVFNTGMNYSTLFLTNTIIAGHTAGIVVVSGNTATLESTLWYDNDVDWDGAGTIVTADDYTGDPAFVNPAAGDYHIEGTSAAIDRGVDAGVTVDIDGDVRPIGTAYDLGADERASTVTPIAGLVATNDSPTVLGSDTTLTATITSGSDVTYSWDFGDDDTGSGAVVAHEYPAVGVYTAVVTATNPVSVMTATTSVTIVSGASAGVNLSTTAVYVTEGGTATYQVVPGSQPLYDVVITVTANGDVEVSKDGSSFGGSVVLTFTPDNWDTPQTVTVRAVDDNTVEGMQGATITHEASSADPYYDGIGVGDVTVTIRDNDVALPLVFKGVSP